MPTAELLFKTAAILDAVSIVGHTAMGFTTVHPALNSIPTAASRERKVGQRGAQGAWNYFNASLLISAALNWQWARTGGPQTTEETVALATTVAMGLVNSFRYAQVGEYPPLACLLVAPLLSLAATLKG
ncbi:hypothetical protein UCRNP2_9060 [Neofusicoccum parvum UCRNP2]|uniref:Integral membrane protein n=2 Tax=Neofusicoccum parvum TaxID=310453 RepID=R1G7W0_BOTPV|nr:hypothetical protein UCRNP2_9060 [Neofusicoccum parvum UCRNP2]GME26375.1 hypothetical protein GTA08_BOTSDO01673 [Neofusicoccum parvum]